MSDGARSQTAEVNFDCQVGQDFYGDILDISVIHGRSRARRRGTLDSKLLVSLSHAGPAPVICQVLSPRNWTTNPMASLINSVFPEGLRLRLELKGSRIPETKSGSLIGIVIALDGNRPKKAGSSRKELIVIPCSCPWISLVAVRRAAIRHLNQRMSLFSPTLKIVRNPRPLSFTRPRRVARRRRQHRQPTVQLAAVMETVDPRKTTAVPCSRNQLLDSKHALKGLYASPLLFLLSSLPSSTPNWGRLTVWWAS